MIRFSQLFAKKHHKPANQGLDDERFVRMAYRSVLRREADPDGLKHYTLQLSAGALQYTDLLEELTHSREFRDNYAVEDDCRFSEFLTEESIRCSMDLSSHRPFTISEMDRCVPGLVGLEYYEIHKRRFLEMINALSFIEQRLNRQPKILEVGSIFSTKIVRSMFAHSSISTIDVLELDQIGYSSVFALKDLVNRHYRLDLAKDDLERTSLEEQGLFDVVLLCEVIEHLLVNPRKVLSFLLRQLKAGGYIYLTTPNAFKRDNVRLFNRRIMPFPAYPEAFSHEDAFMFHIREYGMSELLEFTRSAGGVVSGFYFSDCWDDPNTAGSMAPHELGNLVVLIQKPYV